MLSFHLTYDFYPSITKELLTKALTYADKITTITNDDRHIIMHAKQALLFHNNQPWTKKDSTDLFDVTMGSYDGAETCELVGTYLLSLLPDQIKNTVGLYRDDGLAVCKATPRTIENIKKQICKTFKDHNLKLTIEANKKVIDFLDVTLNLNNNSYQPYKKPGNTILYVHRQSNHPPTIIKNLPENINRRLNTLSSNRHVFDNAAPKYQQALNTSGYDYKLEYKPTNNNHRT